MTFVRELLCIIIYCVNLVTPDCLCVLFDEFVVFSLCDPVAACCDAFGVLCCFFCSLCWYVRGFTLGCVCLLVWVFSSNCFVDERFEGLGYGGLILVLKSALICCLLVISVLWLASVARTGLLLYGLFGVGVLLCFFMCWFCWVV